MSEVSVALVGSHRIFLESFAQRLGIDDITAAIVAPSALDAPIAIDGERVDVIVLDCPTTEELLNRAHRIRQNDQTTPILALVDDATMVSRGLRSGIRGFFARSGMAADFAETVVGVLHGEVRIPSHLVGDVLGFMSAEAQELDELRRRLEPLTSREREILALLAGGLDRRDIASQLFISVNTVRTHLRRILQKLGVDSQLKAVRLALRANMVTLGPATATRVHDESPRSPTIKL